MATAFRDLVAGHPGRGVLEVGAAQVSPDPITPPELYGEQRAWNARCGPATTH